MGAKVLKYISGFTSTRGLALLFSAAQQFAKALRKLVPNPCNVAGHRIAPVSALHHL